MYIVHPFLVCSKITVLAAPCRLRILCWAPFKYLDGSAVQHVTLLPWTSNGGEDSSKDATGICLEHDKGIFGVHPHAQGV